MTFTTAQTVVVKADILASPDMNTIAAGGDGSDAIALLYNKPAVPAFFVWKTDVSVDEIMSNVMDWVRAEALSVSKARSWDWMTRPGFINASKTNVRAGIDSIWSAPADATLKAAIYTLCNRPATRLEKLLATGIGTTAAPATMAREGQVSYQLIEAVRGS